VFLVIIFLMAWSFLDFLFRALFTFSILGWHTKP
jgi:hypothetical protein